MCLQVNGTPLLIPLQTCPQNCNQNAYQSYQNPLNIPLMVQTNPTQQIPVNVIQQPNNNALYNQGNTPQNQVTLQNQASNTMANQINQMYMNKILSNPTIQTMLEPTMNMFQQHAIEVPRQINNIPNNQCPINPSVPCSSNSPNVVNNYFILPPEYFENIELRENRRPNSQKREREDNRRTNNSPDGRRPKYASEEVILPEQRRRIQKNRDHHQNSAIESRRRHYSNDGIDYKYSGEEFERVKKRRKPVDGDDFERERNRNVQPRRNPPNRRREYSGERSRPHQHGMRKPDLIISITDRPIHKNSPKITSSEKHFNSAEQVHKKNSRNSRDDAIVQDFRRKFPAIPEETVRKLISYLRKQLHKQQFENSQFHYPEVSFPFRYDELFPNFDFQDHQIKPNRKPQDRRPKGKNNTRPTVETTTNVEQLTTIPATTERAKVKTVKPPKERPSKKIETVVTTLTPVTQENDETKETTTIFTMPELGTEDAVLDISNRIINDYYPDFTNNNKYSSSEEMYSVRNLRDNRYYYTTDRNYKPKPSTHEYNRNKLRKLHKVVEDSFEDVIRRPDTEEKIFPNYDELESDVDFRTPPLLDSPNFQTKQLVKQKPSDYEIQKQVSYKSSTYSDVKSPLSEVSKGHKAGNTKKTKADNIETVYAHSKVVKYGKTNEESEENVTPVVTYYLPDNMQYEEDGKTVVIAKSIPADHFW